MKIQTLILAGILLFSTVALASVFEEEYYFSPSLEIPDGDPVGVIDVQAISDSQINSITSLTVDLEVSHDFLGLLWVGIAHNDHFVTLVDNLGVSEAYPGGYGDTMLNVTFSDDGLDDDYGTGIHRYRFAINGDETIPVDEVTGTWQTDVDPANGSLPALNLGELNNLPVNGEWTIWAGSCETGGTGMLTNWALHITGSDVYSGVDQGTPAVAPYQYLAQNHPNPFNPSTVISYVVQSAGPVSLSIHDLTGGLVVRLVDMDLEAGAAQVTWSGRDANGEQMPSGVYCYHLVQSGIAETRKMVLLK